MNYCGPDPVLITPPTSLPASVPEARGQARVDTTSEDDVLLRLLTAATDHVDGWNGVLGRCLEAQSWEIGLPRFPAGPVIVLPLGPVDSVTSIVYLDEAEAEQTLAVSVYEVDANPVEARIVLADGERWPATAETVNAVRVRWVAGTGTPPAIKQAILELVAYWYDHREGQGAIPDGIMAKLWPWRRLGL